MGDIHFFDRRFQPLEKKYSFAWNDSLGNYVSTLATKVAGRYNDEAGTAHSQIDALHKEISYIFDRLRYIDNVHI